MPAVKIYFFIYKSCMFQRNIIHNVKDVRLSYNFKGFYIIPLQRRGLLVFAHVIFPYLVDKFLSRLSYRLEANLAVPGVSPNWREWLKSNLPLVRHLLLIVHRTHMGLFYISGVFYHIAKRSSGIQYVSTLTLICDTALNLNLKRTNYNIRH